MLSKYHPEVTLITSIQLTSANIFDTFGTLLSCWKWDKAMDIYSEDFASYTTQYQQAFLKYVQNQYCAIHWQISIIKPNNVPHSNIFLSAKASWFGQLTFVPYDLPSDDEEYSTPNNVATMTPSRSDRAPTILSAARLHLYSPPEPPMNCGQVDPNSNDTTLTL